MNRIKEFQLGLLAINAGIGVMNKMKGDYSVHTKESFRDIVTSMDEEIERTMKEVLLASPYKVMGEESYKDTDKIDLEKETVWVIDPIDGTTNMVSGVPFYSISVGMADKMTFPLGVVIVPPQQELYYTFLNDSFLNSKKLCVKSADLKESLVSAAFSGSKTDKKRRAMEFELFGLINDSTRGVLRTGSASVNICYVAAGRLQAAYGLNNRIWDVAGAFAIAQKAGADIYLERGQDQSRINYVAGTPDAAKKITDLMKENKIADLKLIKKEECK